MNHVLVDDGSGLNIFPLSTLRQLRFDLGKLEQNKVNIRALGGLKRETLGEVSKVIQMGTTQYSSQFKVLYIDITYKFLL